MIVLYILLFVLILGVLVCFHEFGHYFFAKKAGIQINEFAFGMGPKLISKKKGDTYWSIRLFPIGGFCAMSGEDATYTPVKEGDEIRVIFDESNKISKIIMNKEDPDYQLCELIKVEKVDLYGKDQSPLYINDFEVNRNAQLVYSKKEEYTVAPEERNFCSKSVWQRFKVCFGGPFNNLILGLFVFLILGLISGVADTSAKVGESTEGNGILAGDIIESIEGNKIESWNEISSQIYGSDKRTLDVKVLRDGEEIVVPVTASYYFNNIGIASTSDTTGLFIQVESEAALAGNNRTKAYQDGGLRNGDEIVGLIYNGETVSVSTWDQLLNYSRSTIDGGSIILIYIRDGEELESNEYDVYSNYLLETQGYEENSYKQLGITASTKFSFFGGILNGLKYFLSAAATIFSTLWLLLTSSEVGLNDMGGFITILDQTAQYASSITNLLYWVGLLSVNLGIVNLLPIPALDGGRILFIIIEGITGKRLKAKTENLIINIFFYLLMALVVYILIQDVVRLGGKLNITYLKTFLIAKKYF